MKSGAFETKELALPADTQQVHQPDTPIEDIDKTLAVLVARKEAWVATGIPERISILEEISRNIIQVAEHWINSCLEAKGIHADPLGEAEEWVYLATVLRALKVLRNSLIDIHRYGRPRISGQITIHPNGQAIAKVFPRNRTEKLMFRGITGEVWMEPGVTAEEVIRTQALLYQDKKHQWESLLESFTY